MAKGDQWDERGAPRVTKPPTPEDKGQSQGAEENANLKILIRILGETADTILCVSQTGSQKKEVQRTENSV